MNVGEKCSVTLREASMGKFVNLSERGSGGGSSPGPRSALKAVLHFHGIMSACVDAYVVATKYAANVLVGIFGISGWQFPVISRAFFLGDALPLHDSFLVFPRVINRETVRLLPSPVTI